MPTNLNQLLRNALLNNTYDYKAMHDTLKNTWTNSYSYLYTLQKSYIEYEEHNYVSNDEVSRDRSHIGHLYVNKSLKACFDIDYDFIHVCNREEFKRSKFYANQFSFTDMADNPQIFHKLPVILIDGKAIWDYKLIANKNSFTVILPYSRKFVVSTEKQGDVVYLDHNIKVFIIDNVMYERVTVNKSQILNIKNKTLSIDTSWLQKKVTNKEGIYFISVHIPNKLGANYEMGTVLMPCVCENNKIICQLNQADYSAISKYTKNLFVSVVFVNQLHSHTFYTGDPYTECVHGECDLFILQRDECVPYAMPIPVENLMIIKKRNDELIYLNNTEVVELYYPNIYHIKDKDRKEGDRYYIYYFYKYAESLKFSPLFDFYYEFLKIRFKGLLLEKIVNMLYTSAASYSIIIFENGQHLEIPGIEDINLLLAACGNSELDPNVEFIFDCGDSRLTVNALFMQTFMRVLMYGFFTHKYGEIDFSKRYLLETENIDKHPTEYKDETLREWIAEDPKVLKDYVMNQNKLHNSIYHLWTKTINLKSRLRTSTKPEMGEIDGMRLAEESYVFAFRNTNTTSGKLLNIRVFVDGIYAVNMTQVRHYFTDYIYIPAHLVTEDSYIEVEIFPSYEYSKQLRFTSLDEEINIELFEPDDNIYPTVHDLYYIAPNGHVYAALPKTGTAITPSTGGDTIRTTTHENVSLTVNGMIYEPTDMYDPEFFELTAQYKEGNYTIETTDEERPVVFTRLDKFNIKPLSEHVLNKDIIFCISKAPKILEVQITEDLYPSVSIAGHNFKFDTEYIRVFKNGRLLGKSQYIFTHSYSFPRISFLTPFEKGDILHVDITPYKYQLVYYQEEITSGQNIIDLRGYIDKPFDIRYYDVYLNGRRLSLNNVFAISPWKISLVNLHSIYDLQIYEKERDYEYFGSEYIYNEYYYTADDLIDASFVSQTERTELIDRIIEKSKDKNLTIHPNENTEDRVNNDALDPNPAYMYLFYKNELIPKKYGNPDQDSFLNNIYVKSSYPIIHEKYYHSSTEVVRNEAEYERRKDYESAFMFDPDVFIEGRAFADADHVVYSVGHMDNVSENILNEDKDKTEEMKGE